MKGAARAVNLTNIEAVCQSLESVFAALKGQAIGLSPELLDVLHHGLDFVNKLLTYPERGQPAELTGITQQLTRIAAGEPESGVQPEVQAPGPQEGALRQPQAEEPVPGEERLEKTKDKTPVIPTTEAKAPTAPGAPLTEEEQALPETVRIATAKLDSLFLQAEEMLTARLAAEQRGADLRDVKAMLDLWEKEWAKVYSEVRTVRQLFERQEKRGEQGEKDSQFVKLLEFLDFNHGHIKSLETRLAALTRSAGQDAWFLGGMLNELLEDVKELFMLPSSTLLEIFPKLVRGLSRDQGKDVELAIYGGDIEVDRRVLEELKDSLIHLVRNCIDHGIEKPEERRQKKKPERAKVTIAISQVDSGKIEILISDDGAGIDLAKVKQAAVKRKIVSKEEADEMSDEEVLSLIFLSGVSTSPIVTDLSGRGIGLAIVREKVQSLNGLLSIENNPPLGSLVRMLLPVTLAGTRGILVRVTDHILIIPTANVERVTRIKQDEIKTVENKETIPLDGHAVSLVRLGDVLQISPEEKKDNGLGSTSVLVIGSAEQRIAFTVDEILHEQEVLIKSLGKQLSRVRNIAGATVLGSGKVIPILNVADLMKSAVKVTAAPAKPTAVAGEVKEERKSILVVEDSITSRMLLKNILEAAGYQVKTAVDGADAFATLKTEDIDLVVSDINMPRMNGFALTEKIRSDPKLAELPVVLVTALESPEDRERGIDAGADAYILKSSFDQSNLLEAIRRLI